MKIKKNFLWVFLPAVFLTGCMSGLPSCDSGEAEDLVKQIINQRKFLLGDFVELDEINETAANHDSEIRVCSAKLTTTKGNEKITYSIKWKNKEKNQFILEIN